MATYNQKKAARLNRHVAGSRQLPRITPEDLLRELQEMEEDPFLLLLDGVQDPHNLGACLRTADAAGVQAVVAPRKGSVGLTETVRRIACGGADQVHYIQVGNLNNLIRDLKNLGIRCVATADQADASLYETDLSGPLAVVMGAEGKGVRNLTSKLCDSLIGIPMQGHVECLNLSVATGVCLYEAVRQRGGVLA